MSLDLFQTEVGLREECEFSVNNAYFGTDSRYMGGESLLRSHGGGAHIALALPAPAQGSAQYHALGVLQGLLGGSGSRALREAALRMLASRQVWAQRLLTEVAEGRIRPREVAGDIVQQLESYGDAAMGAQVRKYWPPAGQRLSGAEKIAEAARIKAVLGAEPGKRGDAAKGKALFVQRCAACHVLFAEGGTIGPNLTGYERGNPDFWLVGVLDPSLEIREGYGAYTAKLKDIDWKQDLGGALDLDELPDDCDSGLCPIR
jgi:mono/diheme cytochrome c family protein